MGLNHTGCNDVVFGSAPIGSIPVQISMNYQYQHTEEAHADPKLLNQVQASLGLTKHTFKEHDLSLLYYPKKPLKGDFSFSIPAREGKQPVKVIPAG